MGKPASKEPNFSDDDDDDNDDDDASGFGQKGSGQTDKQATAAPKSQQQQQQQHQRGKEGAGHEGDESDDWDFSSHDEASVPSGVAASGPAPSSHFKTPAAQVGQVPKRTRPGGNDSSDFGTHLDWDSDFVTSSTPRQRDRGQAHGQRGAAGGGGLTSFGARRRDSEDSFGQMLQSPPRDVDTDDDMPTLAELGVNVEGFESDREDDKQPSRAAKQQHDPTSDEPASATGTRVRACTYVWCVGVYGVFVLLCSRPPPFFRFCVRLYIQGVAVDMWLSSLALAHCTAAVCRA